MSTHSPEPTPTSPSATSLGEALSTARTGTGRTVEQVCARTRIRPHVLRDLERGDLASSGGAVYARGHVRTVAQALGVDPAPLLAALEAQAGPPAPVSTSRPAPGRSAPLRVTAPVVPERRGPHWGAAVVAAVGVLVVLMGIGVVTGRGERAPSQADQLFADASPTPRPTATATRTPPLTAAVPQAAGARLRVRVLSGSSWMRVQGAAGTLFEGVFTAGQAPKDFTDAGQLRLLVGNAAALSVVCGSKDLAPAGGAGAVRRFTCTSTGLVAA
jgi:cytoskeleton protein RodZ